MERAVAIVGAKPKTRVRVVQGVNVWRLLRTDRDGASATEIPQMAAAAVRWFLRGKTAQGGLHELVKTGKNQWRFGAVRPLQVLKVSHLPTEARGVVLADRHRVPGTAPSVRAQRPWIVLVRFWWRKPDARIPFPGMTEGLMGREYQLNGADWLLDRAVTPKGDVPDPGDKTWGEVTTEAAADAAGQVMAGIGGVGLAVLLGLYLFSKR